MEKTASRSIELRCLFCAEASEVWRAWTEPVIVAQWFGSDPGGVVLSAKIDPRVGGKYEVHFRDSQGPEHTCFGTYSKVTLFEALHFSWTWKSELGVETFVVIEFVTRPEGTEMRFQHTNLDPSSVHDYEAGWKRTFQKLERVLRQSQPIKF